MTSKMTDFEAYYGSYRPIICEWSDGCTERPLRGKSYCAKHYHKVFRIVSEVELEKQVDKDIKIVEKNEKLD